MWFLRTWLHRITLVWLLAGTAALLWLGPAGWWLPAPALLAALVVVDGIARPQSSLFYPTVVRGSRDVRCVALTFDDGPDAEVTPRIIEALDEAGAKATFFTITRRLAENRELVQAMRRGDHVIANHSWQHSRWQNFWLVGRQTDELARSWRALAAAYAGAPFARLYRPPLGIKIGDLAVALRKFPDTTLVAWSLHSHDTRLASADAIAARVLARVVPGDIILLHDGHDLAGHHRAYTADAVKLILAGLEQRQLECVTIPELLARTRREPV